jgi:GAF domain-containing protein
MGLSPRTHGLLGAMLETTKPYRTADIKRPAFSPLVAARAPRHELVPGRADRLEGRCDRSLLPDEQRSGEEFGDDDEQVIEMLAAHAAVAIENALLHRRSRDLSVIEERNRLARELHDSDTPDPVERRADRDRA